MRRAQKMRYDRFILDPERLARVTRSTAVTTGGTVALSGLSSVAVTGPIFAISSC
jgi:hypothetical protein